MKRFTGIAAYILAGGASSRMGRDKSMVEFAGVPLIVRTARLLEPLVVEVTVVGAADRYTALGLHTIADQCRVGGKAVEPYAGPLLGIVTSLEATKAPWNLILACDLPFLSGAWLSWLLARAEGSDAQVVVPQTRRGLEPLAALYRRECAAPIAAEFRRGVRKVTEGLKVLRIELVDAREWFAADPDGRVLQNMNTAEDFKEAQRWYESQAQKVRRNIRPVQNSPARKFQAAPRPHK